MTTKMLVSVPGAPPPSGSGIVVVNNGSQVAEAINLSDTALVNLLASTLTPLDANHIHAWELTESAGSSFADTGSSAQKVNLAMANAANILLATPGVVGNAPFFGNTSLVVPTSAQADALVSSFSDLPANNWTLEAWAMPRSIGTSAVNMIFSCDYSAGANVQLYLNGTNSNTLQATLNTTGGFNTPSSQSLLFTSLSAVGQWNHYAMTYTSGEFLLYVNGEKVNRTTGTATGTTRWTNTSGTAPRIVIGNSLNGGAPFYGKLSRVRLSNIVRSQDYLRGVYRKGMLRAA